LPDVVADRRKHKPEHDDESDAEEARCSHFKREQARRPHPSDEAGSPNAEWIGSRSWNPNAPNTPMMSMRTLTPTIRRMSFAPLIVATTAATERL